MNSRKLFLTQQNFYFICFSEPVLFFPFTNPFNPSRDSFSQLPLVLFYVQTATEEQLDNEEEVIKPRGCMYYYPSRLEHLHWDHRLLHSSQMGERKGVLGAKKMNANWGKTVTRLPIKLLVYHWFANWINQDIRIQDKHQSRSQVSSIVHHPARCNDTSAEWALRGKRFWTRIRQSVISIRPTFLIRRGAVNAGKGHTEGISSRFSPFVFRAECVDQLLFATGGILKC